MTLHDLTPLFNSLPSTMRFPVLFVGHGNPMNALETNRYTESWRALGTTLPVPHAILSISAHWLTEGTKVHMVEEPKTIHDFWGFPKELYDVTYECSGALKFAGATKELLTPRDVGLDTEWGLDHGTWSVLRHLYPLANIPVYQMSIDLGLSHRAHYELAESLRPLREKGVLIMGSGNLVHNLGRIAWEEGAKPYYWAGHFDAQAKNFLSDGNHDALIDYEKLGEEAVLSIPTPDHYWPMLYALGAGSRGEQITFPVEGIAHGSISMRAIKIG